jgi:ParB-like chromosome segregation protein Spo0J
VRSKHPELHPACAVWPDPTQEEIDRLAESIDRYGQQEAIILDGLGRIVDGRTRWYAAYRAGRKPRCVRRKMSDLAAWEISLRNNAHRKHLPAAVRAQVAVRIVAAIAAGGAVSDNPSPSRDGARSISSEPEVPDRAPRGAVKRAAEIAQVSEATVTRALAQARKPKRKRTESPVERVESESGEPIDTITLHDGRVITAACPAFDAFAAVPLIYEAVKCLRQFRDALKAAIESPAGALLAERRERIDRAVEFLADVTNPSWCAPYALVPDTVAQKHPNEPAVKRGWITESLVKKYPEIYGDGPVRTT